mmetsp:Transcript_21648/g.51344  ORF Transcript_21648/g.51344 Transcript_21648/m.51344 type:complete len:312 (-) Transcript_21648:223-1158(-)
MVAGSERRSNLEESAAWSAPRVTTRGQMTLREKDMAKEWTAHGVKPRILGYISMGDSVPEVMTTDWNLSKTGFMAMEASLQQNWKRGSCSVGVRSSKGSMRMLKPVVYVATRLAKSAMSMMGVKSCTSVTSRVRSSERSRSLTNLSVFGSISSSLSRRSRKACGDSCVTTSTDIRLRRCATSRRRKRTNWSARRRLPGTACCRMSLGSTGLDARPSKHGLAGSAPDCARPLTSLWYSSLRRVASVALSLAISLSMRLTLRLHASSVGTLKLIDMTSMQMLSMLCASSKTTTHSRWSELEMSVEIFGSRRYW